MTYEQASWLCHGGLSCLFQQPLLDDPGRRTFDAVLGRHHIVGVGVEVDVEGADQRPGRGLVLDQLRADQRKALAPGGGFLTHIGVVEKMIALGGETRGAGACEPGAPGLRIGFVQQGKVFEVFGLNSPAAARKL
jgi:hypothetical protein